MPFAVGDFIDSDGFDVLQIGMNSNSCGQGMRSYPGRGFQQPEQMGLLLALGTTSAMMRALSPVPLILTEW